MFPHRFCPCLQHGPAQQPPKRRPAEMSLPLLDIRAGLQLESVPDRESMQLLWMKKRAWPVCFKCGKAGHGDPGAGENEW